MLASQQLSWFSLPVIADQSLSTSSWISAPRRPGANHQASLSDLARSFCQDTSSEFDPESSGLPATSEIVSPSPASVHDQYQSCFNHVNRSLQILYHEQERDQAFLASWKWKWGPLVHNDTDRPRPQSSTTVPIPIHHIWIGHALPNGWKELQRQWAKHHHPTEFSFHLHHDPALDSLTHAKDPRMLSDIKRLEVLYTFGGIYSDLDVWPVQSFLPLVQQARQWVRPFWFRRSLRSVQFRNHFTLPSPSLSALAFKTSGSLDVDSQWSTGVFNDGPQICDTWVQCCFSKWFGWFTGCCRV